MMKAIQVIDGANNCLYEIYQATAAESTRIFPDDKDIQFNEDVIIRLGDSESSELLGKLWIRPLNIS
ncbi:MAG: hypothetical protein RR063_12695, partial [Anaerovoracaceae bacterium]